MSSGCNRVVITGGTGLIGRALAAELVAAGREVVVLSRHPKRHLASLPAKVRAERWDGRTAEGWGWLADGADAIVNLAGENLSSGLWTAERKRRILESRVNAGRAVVQAVEAAGTKPDTVIQASAVGYYGPHGDEEVTESTPPGTGFLAGVCVEWEASTASVERLGVRRCVVRTGVVLSASGGALPRMALPFRLFAGGPLGDGRQWLPWIHLCDEVAAIRRLIDDPGASGPINLSAPDPLTNARFSRVLADVLRRPALMRVPAFALRLVFGEMATVLLEGQRAVPGRLLDLGFAFGFPHAEAALRDLFR